MGVTPKAGAAGIAGAISVVFIWCLGLIPAHTGSGHVEMPPEISSSITTIISFAAAYFAPKSQPTPPPNP